MNGPSSGCLVRLLAVALVFIAPAHADPAFISDKLVVSVYAEPNQDSERVATLESGDALDTLEQGDGFTKVKLADGREGWVRSAYVVTQPPAVVRVKQLEKERATSAAHNASALQEELKLAQEENKSLRTELDALKRTPANSIDPIKSSPPTPVSAPASSEWVHGLKWAAAIALVFAALGFAFGYRSVAKRIERKYGRLKIY